MLLPPLLSSGFLQVKLPKEVAQAYALAQLQANEAHAERALSLFTATGTAVLVQGKLTTTPGGTKQVCTMLLLASPCLELAQLRASCGGRAPCRGPFAACELCVFHCLGLPQTNPQASTPAS